MTIVFGNVFSSGKRLYVATYSYAINPPTAGGMRASGVIASAPKGREAIPNVSTQVNARDCVTMTRSLPR